MKKLTELSMWEDWQEIVKRSLPQFAASPIYVQQRSQTQQDFENAADHVSRRPLIDPEGKLRDVEFGGISRQTKACGGVTRMWLDSETEIDFLLRHLWLADKHVLDIGAGYGRLAVPLSRFVSRYHTVDAVPISTEISRHYLARFAPSVQVHDIGSFSRTYPSLKTDLAINIHSWNECSVEQIDNWLTVLEEMRVPWLFTVSNGSLRNGKPAYCSWGGKGDSFRPLIETRFTLAAEESIGLSNHPHALWKLK